MMSASPAETVIYSGHPSWRSTLDCHLGGIGLAVENNCAIEFIDGRFYRVITSKDYARAYRLYKDGGKVFTERIRQQKQLAPIDLLYCR